jgi:hypothetical protein
MIGDPRTNKQWQWRTTKALREEESSGGERREELNGHMIADRG